MKRVVVNDKMPDRVMLMKPEPLPAVDAIEPGFVRDERTGRTRRARGSDRLRAWLARLDPDHR